MLDSDSFRRGPFMCQSFIGAIGSGASVRFHHMQAYTWAAAIVVLLTGCVEVASVLTEAGTVKLLLRGAPVQKYQSGWLPDTVLHGPSASERSEERRVGKEWRR